MSSASNRAGMSSSLSATVKACMHVLVKGGGGGGGGGGKEGGALVTRVHVCVIQ